MNEKKKIKKESDFAEGVDYYYENGLMVLTAHYLKKRGYCCDNGCRHCPYQEKPAASYKRNVSSSSLDL